MDAQRLEVNKQMDAESQIMAAPIRALLPPFLPAPLTEPETAFASLKVSLQ